MGCFVIKSANKAGSNTQKLVFKQNTKYMLICGYLNTFSNTFWGDGIWYFKCQILLASVTVVYHPNMLDEV